MVDKDLRGEGVSKPFQPHAPKGYSSPGKKKRRFGSIHKGASAREIRRQSGKMKSLGRSTAYG